MNNTHRILIMVLIFTFSISHSFASSWIQKNLDRNNQNCASNLSSQQVIEAYLTLEVQGSLKIGKWILEEIQKAKASSQGSEIELSGNVYVLRLSRYKVEIESEYGDVVTTPQNAEGLFVTQHSLCEFETLLISYLEKLKT